jgi:hypothetical protein
MGVISADSANRTVTIQPQAGESTFSFYTSGKK